METVCYIVGACEPGKIVIDGEGQALVIAADAGLRHLEDRGIVPDLVIGDFDSLERIPAGGSVLQYPVEKDDTDTMLAVKEGLRRGCRRFELYGCMGGRPDHAYANYQALCYLAARGARGYLRGGGWVVTAIHNGEMRFPSGQVGTVSVFCPDGVAEGVTLRGLYYSLEGGTLTSGFPLGVSNRFIGGEAAVSVDNGTLLIMWEESGLE